MIGEHISHYRIIDLIGEGGMGAIYKAEDLRLQRMVALKILPFHLTRNKEAKDRFIQEARSASALDHPNICTIFDFDETPDGRLFIAMALYEGDTLENIIRQDTLALAEILGIIIQIAGGLSKAHAKGIVHRDIKPANIILTSDRQIKILDFGLAKLAGTSDVEKADNTSGTMAYMSPEQVQGKSVDDRSDIWSLGVVLYELLTGRRPFAGQFRQSIVYSIINETPAPLVKFDKALPPQLQTILDRAMAKNQDRRYPHILEMMQDLEHLRDSLDGRSDRSSEEIVPKPKHKLIVPALAVFFAVVIWSVWLFIPVHSPPENTITVLPFTDHQTGYMGKGVARDLLTTLADIDGLTVVMPSSSDSASSVEVISRSLNVRYILRGTVEPKEERIRLHVQLLSMPGEKIVWSELYESPLARIRTLEAAITGRIKMILKKDIGQMIAKPEDKPVHPQAYDYYLKGREYYYRYRQEDNETAIALFQKSIIYDSLYASAHAGLADAYAQKTMRFGMGERWLDSTAFLAQRALKIDPACPEAYKALALVAYTRSRFDEARELNREALKFNPSYSPAIANLAWTCLNLGMIDSARYWFGKALQHNPTNPAITMGNGLTGLCIGDYDEARFYLEKTLDLDPGYQPSPVLLLAMLEIITVGADEALENIHSYLEQHPAGSEILFVAGDAALQTGNPGLASEYYQKILMDNPQAWHPFTGINITTSLGYIFHKTGYHSEADELLTRSLNLDQQNLDRGSEWWGLAYDLAAVHAIQGKDSLALDWLDQASQKGFVLFQWLKRDPLFEGLRGNGKFEDMVRARPRHDP